MIFYFKESPEIVKGGGGPHTNQEPTLIIHDRHNEEMSKNFKDRPKKINTTVIKTN